MIAKLLDYNRKINESIYNKLLLEVDVEFDEYAILKSSICDKSEQDNLTYQTNEIIMHIDKEHIEELDLEIDWYDLSNYNEDRLESFIVKLNSLVSKYPKFKDINNHAYYLIVKLTSHIERIKRYISSRLIIINGDGATGKTHLLTKLTEQLLTNGYPVLTMYGHMITNIDDYLELIKKWTNEPSFFDAFKKLCIIENVPGLIILDALNETRVENKLYVVDKLLELSEESNLKIIISYRNGDIDGVVEDRIKEYPNMTLYGFSDEVEAAIKFSEFFDININELLEINFGSNPLLLKIYCEQYNRKKREKGIRGTRAATFYYESFFKEVIRKIFEERKITKINGDVFSQINMWNIIAKDIAKIMVNESRSYVMEFEALQVIDNCDLNISSIELLTSLTIHNVFERFMLDYSKGIVGYRFSFQKLSDFMITRYLLNTKTDSQTWSDFFNDTKIVDYLNSNPTLIESLVEDTPPRANNKELFEILDLNKYNNFVNRYITGLKFRSQHSLGPDVKSKLKEILEFLKSQKENINYSVWWELILSVMIVQYHPFNYYYYTSGYFQSLSTHERDLLQHNIPSINYSFRYKMLSLLKIPYYTDLKKHDKLFKLNIAISYFWMLSLSDRELRDKATKGLTILLADDYSINTYFFSILPSINDQYIIERHLSASYSALLLNKDSSNLAATYSFILNGYSNTKVSNYRIRHYVSRIIELCLQSGVDVSAFRLLKPDFNTSTLVPIEYEKILKFGLEYSGVYSSLYYDFGDFSNYIVKPSMLHFLYIDEAYIKTVLRQFYDFYNTLTSEQIITLESAYETKIPEKDDLKSFIDFIARTQNKNMYYTEKQKMLHNFTQNEIAQFDYFNRQFYSIINKRFSVDTIHSSIAERMINLGYDKKIELLDQKNKYMFYNYSRHDHKIERLGKKYQWIAYFEFLGECFENLELKDDYYDKDRLLSIDIDPLQYQKTTKEMYDFNFEYEKALAKININWNHDKFTRNFDTTDLIKYYFNIRYNGSDFVPLYVSSTLKNDSMSKEVYFRMYSFKLQNNNKRYLTSPDELSCYKSVVLNYEFNLADIVNGMDEIRYLAENESEDQINLVKQCYIESEFDYSNIEITHDGKNRSYYLPIHEIVRKLKLEYDYAGVLRTLDGSIACIQSPYNYEDSYLYIRKDLIASVFEEILISVYSEKNQKDKHESSMLDIGSEYDAVYRLSSKGLETEIIHKRPYRAPVK